jgi:hypothetical protein
MCTDITDIAAATTKSGVFMKHYIEHLRKITVKIGLIGRALKLRLNDGGLAYRRFCNSGDFKSLRSQTNVGVAFGTSPLCEK